jgi:hypothetical protein
MALVTEAGITDPGYKAAIRQLRDRCNRVSFHQKMK